MPLPVELPCGAARPMPPGTAGRDADGLLLPLTGRPRSDVLCWRSGRTITVGRFLAEVAALATRLPDRAHAVNLCTDR